MPVCLCGGSAKTIPAAEEHLPANLCPLIKSTFGYHAQKSNPFLEMADLVVAMENCTGLKPIWDDVDHDAADPVDALAERYFHLPCSVMTRNDRRLEILRQMAEDYRPQCVIELIWQACLTYDVESSRVKRLVERELGLPYLRIETDYSPSDSARIAVRVEALFETARDRKRR